MMKQQQNHMKPRFKKTSEKMEWVGEFGTGFTAHTIK
jgi:hypothetical protein